MKQNNVNGTNETKQFVLDHSEQSDSVLSESDNLQLEYQRLK